ncbi:MAG: Ig-like domain-containing protein, partial [Bacilli bacterium]
MIRRTHSGKFLLTSLMMLSAIGMASCKKSDAASTSSQQTSTSQKDTTSSTTAANVKVSELQLSLAKSVARIGDTVEATVRFQPTTATNKEFTLASSDETIAKIVDGKISCLARGKATITARSSENPLKKSSA